MGFEAEDPLSRRRLLLIQGHARALCENAKSKDLRNLGSYLAEIATKALRADQALGESLTNCQVSRRSRRMPAREKLSDQLRQAIEESTMSRYEICKRVGMDQGGMSHFMAGKCGLSMETFDQLAEFLDLQITAAKGRRRRKA